MSNAKTDEGSGAEREIDLTTAPPVGFPLEREQEAAASPPPDAEQTLGPPEPIEQQREKVRTNLAIGLFFLLALSVVGVASFLAADYINGEEAGLILGPVATLAGTVFGFYFAGRAPQTNRETALGPQPGGDRMRAGPRARELTDPATSAAPPR